MLRAIIFDFDGVIADAEPLHLKAFQVVLSEEGINLSNKDYDEFIRENLVIFPGVVDFIKKAYGKYALAIASGALRHEIEFILECAGIRKEFNIIVSAHDVENCKPNPEVFVKVLERVNKLSSPKSGIIHPSECLVIEDSIAGIKAAHSAGMKCLAVTNSYSPEKLSEADMIVKSLEEVKIEDIEKLF